MVSILYAIGSLSMLAFVVWLIGFALHRMGNIEPSAGWCLVMMICCAVMTLGNVLGILSGNFFAIIFLFLTVPGTVQYYQMWQARRRRW